MREVFEGIECRAQNPFISGFNMNTRKFGSLNPRSSARIQLKYAQELLINPNLQSLESPFVFGYYMGAFECLFFAPIVFFPFWFPNLCVAFGGDENGNLCYVGDQ